ncbi:head maturation protease, ClpP-related [Sporosarcina sp. P17b]|uniref:head maturation protease, ClpP-related n=1 Tax=Sporosarcina sp. P17b TaxID=2048260 RepID=UPI000C16C5FD|nr:head maturation protease, ClpP-related [Sporosarcina sp. P17b]PIC75043.1 Clp protease ClpP [Sporosarcina sp. P17b]
MEKEKYFNFVKKNSNKAEIYIYGYIMSEDFRDDQDTSAISFKKELDGLGNVKEIELHVNSGGGMVFEAAAIYNMLKRHPATITAYIDGLAASAASMIVMAASKVYMPENGFIMIHNAWSAASGDHREMTKQADVLRQLTEILKVAYIEKGLNISKEELTRLMDEETWLDCRTAIGFGFADEMIRPVNAAASIDRNLLNQYQNVPDDLERKLASENPVDKKQNNLVANPLVKAFLNMKGEN